MAFVNIGSGAIVKVVSGFIEIPDHPRGSADYRALGAGLIDALGPYEGLIFDSDQNKVEGTWLAQYLRSGQNITHSVADNPAKNTLAYHCVQHEKLAWLAGAAEGDVLGAASNATRPADTYVWIDYGILHVPGVTAAVIRSFLDRISSFGASVLMPGCWPRREVPHDIPCWRFCGGLIVVPRPLLKLFVRVAQATAVRQIMSTRNVEWEVNTLARVELLDQVPITWYEADHDQTMFTGAP